jgi:predicted acylesterase/phospholipase RssA
MSPEKSFETIALCLSGGGYRAAAFHLGTLSMLDKLGLLENVKILSTVSGGTLLASSYTAWRINQKDNPHFKEFYDNYYKFLIKTNVITDALKNLKNKKAKNDNDSLSLICEAAHTYYEKMPFVKGKTFGDFFDENKKVKEPFQEIIFNSTEFIRGNSFRFQISNRNIIIGNKICAINFDEAKSIRLADIAAASSCFPSAFEPINYPKDFFGMAEKSTVKNIPLMDGGIFDNQGIDSVMRVDNEKNEIDFFMVSDTNQRQEEMLKPHITFDLAKSLKKNATSWIANAAEIPLANYFNKLWEKIKFLAIFTTLILLGYAIFLVYEMLSFINANEFSWRNVFSLILVYYFPFSVSIILIGLIRSLFSLIDLLDLAEKISVNDLGNLFITRISSLVTMSSNVFMKSIRDSRTKVANQELGNQRLEKKINYLIANGNPDDFDKNYEGRIAYNYIYDLNPTNNRPELLKNDPELQPTELMKKISKNAENIETTLWFSNEKDLKNLIVCGRITACLSIMKFLIFQRNVRPKEPDFEKNKYYNIYNKAKNEWKKFKEYELESKNLEEITNENLNDLLKLIS